MVIEKEFTKEKQKNAIDLVVTMVVSELSEDLGLPASELLPQFILSQTGKLLYDESSKLWWSGPSDIAQMYKKEIKSVAEKEHMFYNE